MTAMSRNDVMKDPIYGDANNQQTSTNGGVRALVRKGHDLIINRGSSITIRVDAPLKISLAGSSSQNSAESTESDQPKSSSGGKHFSKKRGAAQADSDQGADQADAMPPVNRQAQGGTQGNTQSQTAPQEQPGSSF